MKLALIRRRFSATGGAELYLQRLLAALSGAGHELHLFAQEWAATPAGVTLHSMQVSGSRARQPVAFAEAVDKALAAERFDCVFSLERTIRQDVYRAGDGVHRVWLERRREFASWWRRPFVGHGAFHRAMMALEARTFDPANTRRVIVNSQMVAREIQRCFHFPTDRIHLIRNGIDVERFQRGSRAETRARWGIRKDEFLMLFVGSGWERKGLNFVLRAMPQYPPARCGCCQGAACAKPDRCDIPATTRLLVVGKGKVPYFAPGNIDFAGPMSDVENAYAAADVLVFPPIYEPCANVVGEALAAGLPVVTSAQNGASELIEEGVNGTVLANPADRDALIRAIEYWRAAPRNRIKANLADLSLDRNVKETIALLEQTAHERR